MRIYTETGKFSGVVRDRTFFRNVKTAKHQLRYPKAWCMDESILDQLKSLGVRMVEFHDTSDGMTWTAPVEKFITAGFVVDRGHGVQRGLSLDDWEVKRDSQFV